MVVDSSVLIHIVFRETGWQESLRFLASQPRLTLSAVSLVEVHAVLKGRQRRGGSSVAEEDPETVIDALLDTLGAEVVPFGAAQARLAQRAYSRYGKGQGHPAGLNFGDVVVYALAANRDEVLAFVGEDFSQTDLAQVALPLA